MLASEKHEEFEDRARARVELELESNYLDIKRKTLEEHLPNLAEDASKIQAQAVEIRNEIQAAEKEKDVLMSTLHWEAQSRMQKDCELLGLTMELEYCRDELTKLNDIMANTQLSIDQKLSEVHILHQERKNKLACLEKMISSRECELSSKISEATLTQLSIIHRQQELEVINQKIGELDREAEKRRIWPSEAELHQKYSVFNEIQKTIIEKETKDSVFKLRADYIDGKYL